MTLVPFASDLQQLHSLGLPLSGSDIQTMYCASYFSRPALHPYAITFAHIPDHLRESQIRGMGEGDHFDSYLRTASTPGLSVPSSLLPSASSHIGRASPVVYLHQTFTLKPSIYLLVRFLTYHLHSAMNTHSSQSQPSTSSFSSSLDILELPIVHKLADLAITISETDKFVKLINPLAPAASHRDHEVAFDDAYSVVPSAQALQILSSLATKLKVRASSSELPSSATDPYITPSAASKLLALIAALHDYSAPAVAMSHSRSALSTTPLSIPNSSNPSTPAPMSQAGQSGQSSVDLLPLAHLPPSISNTAQLLLSRIQTLFAIRFAVRHLSDEKTYSTLLTSPSSASSQPVSTPPPPSRILASPTAKCGILTMSTKYIVLTAKPTPTSANQVGKSTPSPTLSQLGPQAGMTDASLKLEILKAHPLLKSLPLPDQTLLSNQRLFFLPYTASSDNKQDRLHYYILQLLENKVVTTAASASQISEVTSIALKDSLKRHVMSMDVRPDGQSNGLLLQCLRRVHDAIKCVTASSGYRSRESTVGLEALFSVYVDIYGYHMRTAIDSTKQLTKIPRNIGYSSSGKNRGKTRSWEIYAPLVSLLPLWNAFSEVMKDRRKLLRVQQQLHKAAAGQIQSGHYIGSHVPQQRSGRLSRSYSYFSPIPTVTSSSSIGHHSGPLSHTPTIAGASATAPATSSSTTSSASLVGSTRLLVSAKLQAQHYHRALRGVYSRLIVPVSPQGSDSSRLLFDPLGSSSRHGSKQSDIDAMGTQSHFFGSCVLGSWIIILGNARRSSSTTASAQVVAYKVAEIAPALAHSTTTTPTLGRAGSLGTSTVNNISRPRTLSTAIEALSTSSVGLSAFSTPPSQSSLSTAPQVTRMASYRRAESHLSPMFETPVEADKEEEEEDDRESGNRANNCASNSNAEDDEWGDWDQVYDAVAMNGSKSANTSSNTNKPDTRPTRASVYSLSALSPTSHPSAPAASTLPGSGPSVHFNRLPSFSSSQSSLTTAGVANQRRRGTSVWNGIDINAKGTPSAGAPSTVAQGAEIQRQLLRFALPPVEFILESSEHRIVSSTSLTWSNKIVAVAIIAPYLTGAASSLPVTPSRVTTAKAALGSVAVSILDMDSSSPQWRPIAASQSPSAPRVPISKWDIHGITIVRDSLYIFSTMYSEMQGW